MPSPFKKMMPEYRAIEDRLMRAIAGKFGFVYPLAEEVKKIDKYMFGIEWNGCVLGMLPVEYWPAEKAERMFLEAYRTCIKKREYGKEKEADTAQPDRA